MTMVRVNSGAYAREKPYIVAKKDEKYYYIWIDANTIEMAEKESCTLVSYSGIVGNRREPLELGVEKKRVNKFKFFNDTGKEVRIHPATFIHGCKGDSSPIPPLEIREFTLPDGTYPMLKLWNDGTILVSPVRDDENTDTSSKEERKRSLDEKIQASRDRLNKKFRNAGL